jgi:hypothetical protein
MEKEGGGEGMEVRANFLDFSQDNYIVVSPVDLKGIMHYKYVFFLGAFPLFSCSFPSFPSINRILECLC